MIIAVMQPYFFPYLGYFDLIAAVDLWVTLDTVQYIRRGWMHRNRVLHPQQGWQYIHVPIARHERCTNICDIVVAQDDEWNVRLIRQLDHYRRHAPHFEATRAIVQECVADPNPSLGRFNVSVLERFCDALGLRFSHAYLSELGVPLGPIERPDDWALRVCQALGATTYINPSGGRAIYDPERFRDHGIEMRFQEPLDFTYECGPYAFQPGLSIIDVCMWNSIDRLRERWRTLAAGGTKSDADADLPLTGPPLKATPHAPVDHAIAPFVTERTLG